MVKVLPKAGRERDKPAYSSLFRVNMGGPLIAAHSPSVIHSKKLPFPMPYKGWELKIIRAAQEREKGREDEQCWFQFRYKKRCKNPYLIGGSFFFIKKVSHGVSF